MRSRGIYLRESRNGKEKRKENEKEGTIRRSERRREYQDRMYQHALDPRLLGRSKYPPPTVHGTTRVVRLIREFHAARLLNVLTSRRGRASNDAFVYWRSAIPRPSRLVVPRHAPRGEFKRVIIVHHRRERDPDPGETAVAVRCRCCECVWPRPVRVSGNKHGICCVSDG